MKQTQLLVIAREKSQAYQWAMQIDAMAEMITQPTIAAGLGNWRTQFNQLKQPLAIFIEDLPDNEREALLSRVSETYPKTPFILMNSVKKPQLEFGTITFNLETPIQQSELLKCLYGCQAYHESQHPKERSALLFRSLVGTSPAIETLRHEMYVRGQDDSSVLLVGEQACGQEVVARNIHYQSTRGKHAFVQLNCSLLPAESLTQKLFGVNQGAEALSSERIGACQAAEGGTLFLEEVHCLSLPDQEKLLTQLKKAKTQGSAITSFRLIVSTTLSARNLKGESRLSPALIEEIGGAQIQVPSLAQRRDDIPQLVNDLLARYVSEKRATVRLDQRCLDTLCAYHWPGNLRELSNLIDRLCELYPFELISTEDLPTKLRAEQEALPEVNLAFLEQSAQQQSASIEIIEPPLPDIVLTHGFNLRKHLEAIEKQYIQEALVQSKGVVAHAARRLGLRRTTLIQKMRKYSIQSELYHSSSFQKY